MAVVLLHDSLHVDDLAIDRTALDAQARLLEPEARVLAESGEELGERARRKSLQDDARAAHDAVGILVVCEGGRVDAAPANVHEVVVEVRRAVAHNLEHLVGARSGDDGIRGCDRGDDVLDDAQRVHQRDPGDVELRRPIQSAIQHLERTIINHGT